MEKKLHILLFTFMFVISFPFCASSLEKVTIERIKSNFLNPPEDCKPHTYWWWLGNAISRDEITWELEQMHEKGLGGVLITSAAPKVYERGNVEYLSDAYLEFVRHAVSEAKRLNMKVYLSFSPGWLFGGAWIPPEERSQSLVPASEELTGPTIFSGDLPQFSKAADNRGEIRVEDISDTQKLVAVVAGKIVDGKTNPATLVNLTPQVQGKKLIWPVPTGKWRLMAFWLRPTGQRSIDEHWAVDHFSRAAMQHYCEYLGGKFYAAVGDEFGKTVEAFHCDSFELANLPNGIYWSDSLLVEFRKLHGYDLTPYLPAIWWEAGAITPKIRYDVSELLDRAGFEIFFDTFQNWCDAHGVKVSMEPIGFPTDVIEGAGKVTLPMLEITPGEKGAVPWFDTRIGPKKYIASGAHLYGRDVVAVEAYTYLHWELYRATLEEMKIASDGFLRSGVNKFFNHGYSHSPERDVAPSREIPFAVRASHQNIWWPHYSLLAKYIARCCWLLRQGDFAPDIAIYSPLANQWTLGVLNARKWTHDFDWGDLGRLIISSGYDFDLLNDVILQHHAQIENGQIRVRNLNYKILILPNIQALPLETMEFIERYVRSGGVVIALERAPDQSVGLKDYAQKDRQVRALSEKMFREPHGIGDPQRVDYGAGRTYFLKEVLHRLEIYDPPSPADPFNPFIQILNELLPPDFSFDWVAENLRANDGLTFIHRRLEDTDIYFVTNIRERESHFPATFRVRGKMPWLWNPLNGEITRVFQFNETATGTQIPLRLAPYESAFFVFEPGASVHATQSNLFEIVKINGDTLFGLADANGAFQATVNRQVTHPVPVSDLPAPFLIDGTWKLRLKNQELDFDTTFTQLFSWTEIPRTKHFSGTGIYEIKFDLPKNYIAPNQRLRLDLGKVGNVAVVTLNGTPAGTVWLRGQTSDISQWALPGKNKLEVQVTNTLINRVAGFKEPPPVPAALVPEYGSRTTEYSARFQGPIGFKQLPVAGLLGPVRITVLKEVTIGVD